MNISARTMPWMDGIQLLVIDSDQHPLNPGKLLETFDPEIGGYVLRQHDDRPQTVYFGPLDELNRYLGQQGNDLAFSLMVQESQPVPSLVLHYAQGPMEAAVGYGTPINWHEFNCLASSTKR